MSAQRDRDELEKMLRSYDMFVYKLSKCSENERAIIEVAILELRKSINNKSRDLSGHVPGHNEK